jgi:hypothetical protein
MHGFCAVLLFEIEENNNYDINNFKEKEEGQLHVTL